MSAPIRGHAYRLSDAEVREDRGMLKETVKATVREKAVTTIVDITWGKEILNGVRPRFRARLDPRRLMVDLFYDEVDPYEALEWRTRQHSVGAFRENVEKALDLILNAWSQRNFGAVVWADERGIRITNERDQTLGVSRN